MIEAVKRRLRSLGRLEHQRGGTLVEFALAATVSLTMIFGVLEFGRALYTYDLVAHAARLGTRFAAVRGSKSCATSGCTVTSAQVQTYVQSQTAGIVATSMAVSTTWPGNGTCLTSFQDPGCPVRVTVVYPFSFVAFSLGSISMSSTSQMTISQ